MPLAAWLTGLVVVGAVALVMRTGGLARMGIGQAAKQHADAPAPRAAAAGAAASDAGGSVTSLAGAAVRSAQPVVTTVIGSPVSRGSAGGSSPAGNDALSRPAADANAARRYTIDVGTYLDIQRAIQVRDRIQASTGIQAWVVVGNEDAGEAHHIVLGIFRTSDRATAAAEALMASSTLPQAHVIPLPPRRTRR